MTEFVAQFLEQPRAFKEFARVLAPGGYLAFIEFGKSDDIPPGVEEKIAEGERHFKELTHLPFRIFSITQWKEWMEAAGLGSIEIVQRGPPKVRDMLDLLTPGLMASVIGKLIKLSFKSKKLRSRFKDIGAGKKYLLRDRETKKIVGLILGTGRKQ